MQSKKLIFGIVALVLVALSVYPQQAQRLLRPINAEQQTPTQLTGNAPSTICCSDSKATTLAASSPATATLS